MARTRFSKGMCFRQLNTLHQCGFLEKAEGNRYRRATESRRRARYRIGYAAHGEDTAHDPSFLREVHAGLVRAADREQVEVIVVANQHPPRCPLRSAERLIRERVDLVIEFQPDASVASASASRYLEANVPLIAIDIPNPGATYFGANHYQAGLLAGRHLAAWAGRHWAGQVDEVVLLEVAGPRPCARMRGMVAGITEALFPEGTPRVSLEVDGGFKTALDRVREHFMQSTARHVLVGAANDPSALGAARAIQAAGRAGTCAIVGQSADADARAELRDPRSPLVASVGYFPERYGDGIVRLALDILARRPVPPAQFTRHHLITPENVDHFYPDR